MNDLETWLSAFDQPDNASSGVPASQQQASAEESQQLTEDDFEDILEDLGFSPIEDAVIEEPEQQVPNDEELPPVDTVPSSTEASDDADSSQGLAPQVSPEESPLLPPNSPTLLMDDSTSRFSGTEWYEAIRKQNVTIAGIGGIGSWLAFQISRLQPNHITLYDDDKVEYANLSGQMFNSNQINLYKVDAIVETININLYSAPTSIYAISRKFTDTSTTYDIMMCGFDSMAARKTYFTAWNNHVMARPEEERKKCLYLDGRLSIDTLQVFCITGDNDWAMTEYATKHLFSDSEADETVCSLKQTTYMACMISAVMTNLFVNFVANTLNPVIPYDLPFYTEYDAQNMIFKTEN